MGRQYSKPRIVKFNASLDDENKIREKKIRLSGIRARVDQVHIDGLQWTDNKLVENLAKGIFVSQNFDELILNAHKIQKQMEQLKVFEKVNVLIENGKSTHGFDVTFKVEELKPIVGSINTTMGNNEAHLVVGIKSPNIFGMGEKVGIEYSQGTKQSNHILLNFKKPMRPFSNSEYGVSLYSKTSDSPLLYKLEERGFLLDYNFAIFPFIRHHFQYECMWRDVNMSSNKGRPWLFRENAGHTLKSSFRQIFTLDTRDNPIFPKQGRTLQWSTELAGLFLGNIGFLKNEVYSQINYLVPKMGGVSLQFSTQFGMINRIFEKMKNHIEDKVYLGGPLNMRGFQNRGVGAREECETSSGDISWGVAAHVFAPLPLKPSQETLLDLVRMHIFLNMGHCSSVNSIHPFLSELKRAIREIRLSYGAGIVMKFGNNARIELNYVVPLIYKSVDATAPGFQFGVGVKFL